MDDTLMTIGAFARSTGLSEKALRSYDEIGLLRPADVDADTGYRSYAPEQLEGGRSGKLRELDVPLLEIGSLLDGDSAGLFARAHLAAGDRAEAERHAALAREELAAVEDPDDREVIAGQLGELGFE